MRSVSWSVILRSVLNAGASWITFSKPTASFKICLPSPLRRS
jgi:hypothetical protein